MLSVAVISTTDHPPPIHYEIWDAANTTTIAFQFFHG